MFFVYSRPRSILTGFFFSQTAWILSFVFVAPLWVKLAVLLTFLKLGGLGPPRPLPELLQSPLSARTSQSLIWAALGPGMGLGWLLGWSELSSTAYSDKIWLLDASDAADADNRVLEAVPRSHPTTCAVGQDDAG